MQDTGFLFYTLDWNHYSFTDIQSSVKSLWHFLYRQAQRKNAVLQPIWWSEWWQDELAWVWCTSLVEEIASKGGSPEPGLSFVFYDGWPVISCVGAGPNSSEAWDESDDERDKGKAQDGPHCQHYCCLWRRSNWFSVHGAGGNAESLNPTS